MIPARASAFLFIPLLASCAQTYAVRFQDRAFPTQSGQRVELVISRGQTEVRGVVGSRDVLIHGTVRTRADSPAAAELQAGAVRVIETSPPGAEVLRLEVVGIHPDGGTLFDSEFLVPKDIRLEIRDGPEDLHVLGMEGSVSIHDGAGDIVVEDFSGPVEIEDLDGDILCHNGRGPVKITDRRGNITVEEVTGDLDIMDREGDAVVQSITGNLSFGKRGKGQVRIDNIAGTISFPVWENPVKPIFDTVWEGSAITSGDSPGAQESRPQPAPASTSEPAAPAPAALKSASGPEGPSKAAPPAPSAPPPAEKPGGDGPGTPKRDGA